jgi:mono/diheme cytochrome c family protein
MLVGFHGASHLSGLECPMMQRMASLIAAAAIASAALGWRAADAVTAQSLAAPTFTTAQESAGASIYAERCASCHGQNLDDGEFGAPLEGPELRSAWFGRTADVLLTRI